jgi:hypothetical protein
MPPPETDPLQQLRDAAERLRRDVPPAGYATASENRAAADEVEALAALLRTLRDLVPPELQHQVTDVLRQVLLLLRSLIDWWVARLDEGPAPAKAAEPGVEDIHIS